MKTRKVLTVLQDDIDNGERTRAEHCAVARAIRREWGADSVLVGPSTARVFTPWDAICKAVLPPAAVEFIAAFDCGEKVEPFKCEVEVEEP